MYVNLLFKKGWPYVALLLMETLSNVQHAKGTWLAKKPNESEIPINITVRGISITETDAAN